MEKTNKLIDILLEKIETLENEVKYLARENDANRTEVIRLSQCNDVLKGRIKELEGKNG